MPPELLPPPLWGILNAAILPMALWHPDRFRELTSRFASQMLFHRFAGVSSAGVATASDAHNAFMDDLWSLGGHPQKVRARYAIANGAANGATLCTPGEVLLDTAGTLEVRLRVEQSNQQEPPVVRVNGPEVTGVRFEVNLPANVK